MKRIRTHIKKLAASVILSAALIIPAMPTAAADTSLEMLDDNGLPVVYLTIDENAEGYGTIEEMNSSADHSVKCTGTVRIDVPEGYKGDYSDVVLEDTDELQLDYIRGRGNITWIADKKPYKLKLDKKAELLGMGKNKHWALLANRYDVSMIRNRIACYVSEKMGFEYTPRMLPVDLVINGEYAGSYFLAETVRIADSRLNIDELTPEDNSGSELTGGYLLSLDPYYFVYEGHSQNVDFTKHGVAFYYEDPEFYNEDGDAAGTQEQRKYISDYINSVDEAVFSTDFKNTDGAHYSDLMDMDSAIDFWWMQEFLINEDAYITTSNYLYKKRDGKLYWGPVWDFDYSMGELVPYTYGFNHASMQWLDHLRDTDPEYRQQIIEHWEKLDAIITDVIKEGGVLDRYAAEQENSRRDDRTKWGEPRISKPETHKFEEETENVRAWLAERQQWVREHLETDLSKVYCTATFVADGEVVDTVSTYMTTKLSYVPSAPDHDKEYFIGWCDEYGQEYKMDTPLNSDLVLTATYMPMFPEISDPDDPDDPDYPYYPEISEPSEVSQPSEEPEPSEVSHPSKEPEPSEVSQPSEEPEPSEVSQPSEEPEPSEVSQPSEEPEPPEETEPSEVSEPSQASVSSYSSEVYPQPSQDSPNTGSSSPVPVLLVSSAAALLAVIGAGRKKRTNE